MSKHYAYQTHGLYKSLVADIIHVLSYGACDNEKELLDNLPGIPTGVPSMSIHFSVTRNGTIIVDAQDEGNELAYWRLDQEDTKIDVERSAIMSIGRLQSTLERFWDTLVAKCTRIDTHHRRGVARATMITNRVYFADRVLKSWLTNKCIDVTIRPGEIRIGNDVYHINRSWRRDVRGMLAQGV